MNFETISIFVFLVIAFTLTVFNAIKLRSLNPANLMSFSFYCSVLVIGFLELACINFKILPIQFLKFSGTAFLFMNSLVLAAFAMISLQNVTPKKIKTIGKIPLIGLLLGLFYVDFHFYFNIGSFVLFLMLLWKQRPGLRIYYPMALLIGTCNMGSYLFNELGYWYLNFILIAYIIGTKSIWDTARVKFILIPKV
jgi:hypothetical protein